MKNQIFSSLSTRFSFVIVIILLVIVSLSTILSVVRHAYVLQNSLQSKGIALARMLAHYAEAGKSPYLDIDALQDACQELTLDQDVLFSAIIDASGTVLVHSESSLIDRTMDAGEDEEGSFLGKELSTTRIVDSLMHKEVLLIAKRFSSESKYVLIGMAPLLLREAILVTYQYYLSKILIIGVVGILISVILSQKITNPLRLLVEDVQIIAAGDLTKEIASYTRDEIGQLAEAFDNMRLSLKLKIEELDTTISELSSIHELGTTINAELDQERLLRTIVQSVVKGLSFDKALIMTVSAQSERLENAFGLGFDEETEKLIRELSVPLNTKDRYGDAAALREIIKDGQTVLENPVHLNTEGEPGIISRIMDLKPFMVQPLIAQGRPIGVLLASQIAGKDFQSDRIKESLRNIANHAAVALENARLYRRIAEQARLEEELKHAREIEIAYTQLEERNVLLQNTMEELQETQDQLLTTSRLAAVGELSGRVAHEVLNPITAIVTRIEKMMLVLPKQGGQMTELFKEIIFEWKDIYESGQSLDSYLSQKDPGNSEELTYGQEDFRTLTDLIENVQLRIRRELDDLEFLKHHTIRVIKIVDSLRAMSRITGGKEKVNINDALHEAIELMRDGLEKRRIGLSEEYEKGLPVINANFSEMVQVFSNVIKNAMQAIDEKKEAGSITVRSTIAADAIEVRIIDDGIGIDTDHLDRVFDPDFTTKSREEGTGLGLNLSRRFVQDCGGTIIIESSRRGEGTTVLLSFPLVVDKNGENDKFIAEDYS